MKDLSQKGCRIENVIQPFTGMQLELLIHPSDESTPITINNATVRWTGTHGIGFEFLALAPSEQNRLNRMVKEFASPTRKISTPS
ncbi:MAG: PilZ domain-containing protein [Nitrospira sp.]|nr:PilZ domain-containing protein [Nitrospira sp.]